MLGEQKSILKAAVLLAPAVKGGVTPSLKLKRFRNQFFKTLKFGRITHGLSQSEEEIESSLFLDDRLDMQQVRIFADNVQAESKRAQRDLASEYTPYYESSDIPVVVIGSNADLLFPEEDLISTAISYGTSPVVMEIMCHDMMIDPEWERGAIEIRKFTERTL